MLQGHSLANTPPSGSRHPQPLSEDSDDDSCSYDCGWIAWYCSLKGHEMFAEVDEDYIRDAFNLYGLRAKVQFYDHAMEMILSDERPDDEDLADNDFL
mmetsp:Transcript_3165/g.2596  ORF Transcript_3165/g.2596 Transcript_3165/m.2596 type:complete len:98 (+) Transcript_3165:200-493(+)